MNDVPGGGSGACTGIGTPSSRPAAITSTMAHKNELFDTLRRVYQRYIAVGETKANMAVCIVGRVRPVNQLTGCNRLRNILIRNGKPRRPGRGFVERSWKEITQSLGQPMSTAQRIGEVRLNRRILFNYESVNLTSSSTGSRIILIQSGSKSVVRFAIA